MSKTIQALPIAADLICFIISYFPPREPRRRKIRIETRPFPATPSIVVSCDFVALQAKPNRDLPSRCSLLTNFLWHRMGDSRRVVKTEANPESFGVKTALTTVGRSPHRAWSVTPEVWVRVKPLRCSVMKTAMLTMSPDLKPASCSAS